MYPCKVIILLLISILVSWLFLSHTDIVSRAVVQPMTWIPWTTHTGLYMPAQRQRMRHGYFLHITDMHIDPDYVPGSNVRSACHRKKGRGSNEYQQQSWLTRLLRVGRLGAPGEKCDAPVELARQTLDWISREWRDKLDFVIWTGDNSRHDWDSKKRRERKQILRLNQMVTDMMTETFGGNIPIIPALGNNDVYPHNQVVDHDSVLAFYEQIWRGFVPTKYRSTFRRGGYFATDVSRGSLRIVSLNTMYFIKKNKAVKSCSKHGPAREQMIWFERELAKARRENKSVIVIGHVPPSPRDYRDTCFKEYVRISSTYADVILSHNYGHLNMDHFLLYDGPPLQQQSQQQLTDDDADFHVARNIEAYVDWLRGLYASIELPDDQQQRLPEKKKDPVPLVAIHVAPSVLPVYYPGVRIYRYTVPEPDLFGDSQGYPALLGYLQYYANITRWGLEHGVSEPLEYELEYTTDNDYELGDLSAQSLFGFAKDMIEGNANMWTKYTRNMFVRAMNDTFPLDDDTDEEEDGL